MYVSVTVIIVSKIDVYLSCKYMWFPLNYSLSTTKDAIIGSQISAIYVPWTPPFRVCRSPINSPRDKCPPANVSCIWVAGAAEAILSCSTISCPKMITAKSLVITRSVLFSRLQTTDTTLLAHERRIWKIFFIISYPSLVSALVILCCVKRIVMHSVLNI